MKKYKRVILSDERDVPILRFIWRWKVATTATIANVFFKGLSPATAYKRLWTMQRGGFIESRVDERGQQHVWELAKRGFEALTFSLPMIQEKSFRSNSPTHDLLVMAFHLGDWALGNAPKGLTNYSEQILKSVNEGDLPESLVSMNKYHRADGYWGYVDPQKQTTRYLALEVELNRKASADYRSLATVYPHTNAHVSRNVEGVLWLVPTKSMAEYILRHLNGASAWQKPLGHDFFLVSDFKSQGWGAASILGDNQGRTVRWLLDRFTGTLVPNATQILENTPNMDPKQFLLDGRKGPNIVRKFTPKIEAPTCDTEGV